MDWDEKLNLIIDYVEQHLQRQEEPVRETEITELAGCSYAFFQKVFSYLNGISFAEYIRCRKMTLAGYDLKSTELKVIEISYKYGYDSPTSFTRAFQQFHGMTPKEARMGKTALRVYPKMQGLRRPQYSWRLEPKPPLRLLGKAMEDSGTEGIRPDKIPEFWNECQRNGVFSQLITMDSGDPPGLFGVFPMNKSGNAAGYLIMVHSNNMQPPGLHELIIPEMIWAIFDCRGSVPQGIQNGWKFLHEEWLTAYPFLHDAGPELEWYSSGNPYDQNYLSQIWIPIIAQ